MLKFILATILFVSALVQLATHQTWWFIQNVNLIFHEAGHVIFIPFGELLSIAGGSILEVLIPAVVLLHFILTKQPYSASFAAWWLTTAILSVSIYATDAQDRILPLITRDVSTHDWFNLLNQLNLLRYDDVIGNMLWSIALLVSLTIVYIPLRDAETQKKFMNLMNRN